MSLTDQKDHLLSRGEPGLDIAFPVFRDQIRKGAVNKPLELGGDFPEINRSGHDKDITPGYVLKNRGQIVFLNALVLLCLAQETGLTAFIIQTVQIISDSMGSMLVFQLGNEIIGHYGTITLFSGTAQQADNFHEALLFSLYERSKRRLPAFPVLVDPGLSPHISDTRKL
jgi:hypothetical protein